MICRLRRLGAALAILAAFVAPLAAEEAGELVAAPIAVGVAERVAPVVRLLFVGDVMLDGAPGRAIAAGRDPFAEFADEFEHADLRIGNLEMAVASGGTAIPGKFYTFRASPRVLDRLGRRFEAMSVANNHSGDYGQEAFLETLSLLDIAGVKAFGGGRNLAEAHAPAWFERSGLRIAILGYNEYKPRAFEAGPDWPGIAWSEDSHVLRDIAAARAAGADVVIPFMHWGWEGERGPSPRQRELARRMIDAGASAVVGSHPHVTQGSETYQGRPIVYSLGNFIFDSFESPAEREGWLLRLTVGAEGVTHWETIPAFLDDDGLSRRQAPAVAPAPAR